MNQADKAMKKREFTGVEQRYQRETLDKYRKQGILPPVADIVQLSGAKTTTVNMFMWGNSRNEKVRAWMRKRFQANFKTIPADIKTLFQIWDET